MLRTAAKILNFWIAEKSKNLLAFPVFSENGIDGAVRHKNVLQKATTQQLPVTKTFYIEQPHSSYLCLFHRLNTLFIASLFVKSAWPRRQDAQRRCADDTKVVGSIPTLGSSFFAFQPETGNATADFRPPRNRCLTVILEVRQTY